MIAFDQRHVHGTLEMVRQLVRREYSAGMIANALQISLPRAEALVEEVRRTPATKRGESNARDDHSSRKVATCT